MSSNYTSVDMDGTMSSVEITKQGNSKVVEVTTTTPNEATAKPAKKKVDLKKVPAYQTDDTPKTKRRYFYEKTGNYVSYARAKQLGLVK